MELGWKLVGGCDLLDRVEVTVVELLRVKGVSVDLVEELGWQVLDSLDEFVRHLDLCCTNVVVLLVIEEAGAKGQEG